MQYNNRLEKAISNNFELFDSFAGKIVPDWFVHGTIRFIFSKTSVLTHTIWFGYWFTAHLDVALLTNIVSLEAIYIGVFIGIQQLKHHVILHGKMDSKGKITAKVKEVKKV
jgi:ABC-type proline/glycine betaine transport system permease subunit